MANAIEEHMNVSIGPEGDEQKLTSNTTPLEELEHDEERELIELVKMAETDEDLAELMQRYLERHKN